MPPTQRCLVTLAVITIPLADFALAQTTSQAATLSQANDRTEEPTSPFTVFRHLGQQTGLVIWKTGLDSIPERHLTPVGFREAIPFSKLGKAEALRYREAFLRGRYRRSEARSPENIEAWRSQPNVANPGADLANFPNSAFTLPQGRVYIEFEPFSYISASGSAPQQFDTEFLLRYGATDNIELRLFGNGATWVGGKTSAWSFSPIAFDVKIQAWLEKTEYFLPAMGIEAYLQTQWLGNSATNGGTQPGISFNFDQSLFYEIDAEYNLGAARIENPSGPGNEWQFIFQWSLQRNFFSDDFALFLHGYVNAANLPRLPQTDWSESTLNIHDKTQAAAGGGFLWTVNSRLSVWGQTSTGLTKRSPSLISYMGFAVAF